VSAVVKLSQSALMMLLQCPLNECLPAYLLLLSTCNVLF